MRIAKRQNSSFSGTNSDKESQKRQQSFRRQKKTGQEVIGTVLKALTTELAWIEVEGMPLTATLPFEPMPGQRLLLRVESLEPEIVLKFLSQLEAQSGPLQIHAYTGARNNFEALWQNFLQQTIKTHNTEKQPSTDYEQSSPNLTETEIVVGEVFPQHVIEAGEKLVRELHTSWTNNFVLSLPEEDQKTIRAMDSMRLSAAKTLGQKGLRAWLHIPWTSITGYETEMIIIRPETERLEKILISGIWPELGAVLISALCLDKEISCRVYTQTQRPFALAAAILNLGGIGEVLRIAAKQFDLPNRAEQINLTCLEFKQKTSDTVPAILLRM